MAKKKKARRKVRKRTAGRRKSDKVQGWMGMLMGLVIGLVVAFFVYFSELKPPPELKALAKEQTQAAIEAVDETVEKAGDSIEETLEEPQITFDFYDMLPNLDVEVFEDEPRPRAPTPAPKKVTAPGIYIVQAGSFTEIDDANRRKAEIGLLGIRTEIKRGTANNRNVYRIYTSPMETTDEVNRVSGRLRDAGIEILLKRVSD